LDPRLVSIAKSVKIHQGGQYLTSIPNLSQEDVLLAWKSALCWPVRKLQSMKRGKQRKLDVQCQQTLDVREPIDAKEMLESPGIQSPKPDLETMDMFDSDGRSDHSP
jgi:hypothetical protein